MGTLPPAPSLSLSAAVMLAEGNSGTASFVWTLTLDRNGSTASLPFSWAVTGSGANPANAADFGGTFPSGSGTFAPGETSKTITVLVAGDSTVEPNETFALTVTAAGLVSVASTGTVANDDGVALTALTLSTPVLRATMQPGDIVATIAGASVSSALVIGGAAYENGLLALNDAQTAVVVGPNGPGAGGDLTGLWSLMEINVGASNSPRTTDFASIATVQKFYPVSVGGTSTAGSSISRTYTGTSTPGTAVRTKGTGCQQVLMIMAVKTLGNPVATETVFGSVRSGGSGDTGPPRIEQTAAGSWRFRCNGTAFERSIIAPSVGEWAIIAVQANLSTTPYSAAADRMRAWTNGVMATGNPTVGASQNYSDLWFYGYENSVGNVAPSAPLEVGFYWMADLSSAELPNIDFGLDANMKAVNALRYDPGNFNPDTGEVTLVGPSGTPYTIRPGFYVRGSAADFNAGAANLGSYGADGSNTAPTFYKIAGTYGAGSNGFVSESLIGTDPQQTSSVGSVTDRQLTATFTAPTTVWRYADGSYGYDSQGGTIGVASFSTPSAQIDRPKAGGTTGLLWAHGAMLNPGNAASVANSSLHAISRTNNTGTLLVEALKHGYDGWTTQADSNNLPYASSQNVDPGANGGASIMPVSGTIVKALSNTYATDRGGDMIKQFMILTAVNGTPPVSTQIYFRPSCGSTNKAVWLPADDASIDASWLPSLAPVTGAPQFFSGYNSVRFAHQLHITLNHDAGKNITPSPAQESTPYGDLYSKMLTNVLAVLVQNNVTTARKKALLRAVAQQGIDLEGMYSAGFRCSTVGLGSVSQGRKIILAIAAAATGNAALITASKASTFMPENKMFVTITADMKSVANGGTRTAVTWDNVGPSFGAVPLDPAYPPELVGEGDWSSSAIDQVFGSSDAKYPRPYIVPQSTEASGNTSGGVQYRAKVETGLFGVYVFAKVCANADPDKDIITLLNLPPFMSRMQRMFAYESTHKADGTVVAFDDAAAYPGFSRYNQGPRLTDSGGPLISKRMRVAYASYFA